MQFEEFDNKIREAADHHHPSYDEHAWERMEKLLNHHLPRENDRKRRFIIFLLLFFMVGGGSVWLFINRSGNGNRRISAASTKDQKQATENHSTGSPDAAGSNDNLDRTDQEEMANIHYPGSEKTKSVPFLTDQINAGMNRVNKNELADLPPGKKSMKSVKANPDRQRPGQKVTVESFIGNADPDRVDLNRETTAGNTRAENPVRMQKSDTRDKESEGDKKSVSQNNEPKSDLRELPVHKEPDPGLTSQELTSSEKKAKGKSKKTNAFFFSLSAGPDVSFTGSDQLGKTKLLTGIGLGYSFKDRLMIRSGYYSGRKVYTSSPGSYHPPASFWNYYPNLEKVEADCRVSEIPISLSYLFGRSAEKKWFVTAGISSYLMKSETYDYYYKYVATGPTVTRQYSPRDKNNHFFSALTLSGGFRKNIGKSFSVMAEPYFKIPVSGLGFGKVKLNSGGILFSIGVKPFSRSGKPHSLHP